MHEDQSETFENSIDKIKIMKLAERYGVVKQTIYNRLKLLHIKSFKEGKLSYISTDHLQMMDDFDAHLKNGGKIAEFVQQCIASGEIVQEEQKSQAIVTQLPKTITTSQPQELTATEEVVITSESSRQEIIAALQKQKGEQVQLLDIQVASKRAQKRALNRAMAEESMLLIFEATEEYPVSGAKEQLEQHRDECKQAAEKREAAHDINNFLSKSLAFLKMPGTTG